MGPHSNKYITTMVDITHTTTTIDIMRIEFTATVIGIIIENWDRLRSTLPLGVDVILREHVLAPHSSSLN
jgi:hypothetical protein